MNAIQKTPYIGPRTFQRDEGHLFFGREREARDLIALVASERLVIFYAQSGAGKSSIVNTRLIPNLETKEYEVLPIGRVSGNTATGINVDNIYIYNLIRSLEQHDTDPADLAKLSLSQFLAHLNFDDKGFFYDATPVEATPEGDDASLIRRAMVIDQFEEVFSTYPESWEKREHFFIQLAQAMKDDPQLWVVLVMREDYIAALDPYAHLAPNGLRVRYYMQRLEREAALKAVKSPVEEIRPYAEGVAEKLIDDLCSIKVQKPDGTLDIQPGQYAEPVQMQVVCYGLWDNLTPDGKQITEQDLQDVGDVNQSLGKYYDKRVGEVAKAKNIRERLIREWFEKKLITAGGIRNMVLQEREAKPGELDDHVIQALQSDLVRGEKRSGATWYELTHDRLVEPILERNKIWFNENLSPLQRQAALWKDQNRGETWLLRDHALIEVEVWAGSHKEDLTDVERDFLEACRVKQAERKAKLEREDERKELEAAKKLMDEQARSARLARRFSIGAILLMIIAVIASIFAISQSQTAQAEKKRAEEASIQADAQRATAVAAEKNAQEQADTALSGALSAYAIDKLGNQPDLGILLSLQANQIKSDSHTGNALLTSLQTTAHIQSILDQTVKADEAQFSPDGKILALRNKDGIALWDAKSLQPLTTSPINEHFSAVTALALSKDGKTLASASCTELINNQCVKSEIVLWDAHTGTVIGNPLPGHKAYIYTVNFSPDGKVLASGSYDQTVNLWDISDPLNPFIIAILTEHTGYIESVAFSPDGKLLASASDDQTIRLWDAHTGKPFGDPLSGNTSTVNFVTFSPDSKTLASGGSDGTITLWDVATGKAIGDLQGHSETVWYMAFNPDGTILASGSHDKTVRLWNVANRQNIDTFTDHKNFVWSVAFSPDGKIVASSDDDGTIILWNVANHQIFGKPLTQHKKAVYSLAFSPEDNTLVSGSLDSTIIYWNVTNPANPQVTKELKGHLGRSTSMKFNSDGSLLASSGNDGTILIDTKSKTSIGYGDAILTNSNTDIVAYLTKDNDGQKQTIHIRDAKTREEISSIPGENPLFSPDGKLLAYQDDQSQFQLWNVMASKKIPADILGGNPVFSPNSQILITTQDGPLIDIWNTATGENIRQSDQPIIGYFKIFSSDSKVLVYDGQNPKTGSEEIHRLSIAEPDVFDKGMSGTYLGDSENGDVIAFNSANADGIESINLLKLSTGIVTKDIAPGSNFLTLSTDGRILIYAPQDTQGNYVNALNTETGLSIGKQIDGTYVGLWELGRILAYETTTQEGEHSLTLINTSTLSLIDVVSNGSFLGESQDKNFLVYQAMENKKSMIHILDTRTGLPLPASEPIPGTFLSISPDGKTVLFRNESDSIVLWDTTRTWPLGIPVTTASEFVTDAALSLDGNTLAWIGNDGITIQKNGTTIGKPLNIHFGNVTSIIFRPDDKTLVSYGEGGYITIWNFITHFQEGKTFQVGENNNIQVNKDGGILVVSNSGNYSTTLWDLATQTQIGGTISGSTAILSPDGTQLAVGNQYNQTTTVWNLTTRQSSNITIPGGFPAFSMDSTILAVGDYDNNQTTFWSLDPFKEIKPAIPGYEVSFSPNGAVFASYNRDDTTTLRDLTSHNRLGAPLSGFNTFSPNGKMLATVFSSILEDGTSEYKTTLWDISNPNDPQYTPDKNGKQVTLAGSAFEFNPSGNLLATTKYDYNQNKNFVSVFDLTSQPPKPIALGQVAISNFALSPNPDENRLAYVGNTGIIIWDRNSQLGPGVTLKIYPGIASGMAFNKDGSVLAIYGNSGIVLWDINNKQPLGDVLPGPPIPGIGITISPTGKTLASQANDGIILTDLSTNTENIHLDSDKYTLTNKTSFYTNGTRFVAVGDDGTLLNWGVSDGSKPDIADDQDKQPLKGKGNISSAFSPDGTYLAYDNFGHLSIWDIQASQSYMKPGEFPDAENSIGAITFSSDGNLLAYSDGPKILLWDILKKEKLGDLLTGSTNITNLNLIMNEKAPQYLVSTDDSGTTQIWDWATRTKIGIPISENIKIIGFDNSNRKVYYLDATNRLIQWQWGLSKESWNGLLCPLVQRNLTQDEWNLYIPNQNYPGIKDLICPPSPAGQ